MLLAFLIQDLILAFFTLCIFLPLARRLLCRRPVQDVRSPHAHTQYFVRSRSNHDLQAFSLLMSCSLLLMLLVDQDGTRSLYTWPVRYLLGLSLQNMMHVTLSYYVACNIQAYLNVKHRLTTMPNDKFLLQSYPVYLLLHLLVFTGDVLFNLITASAAPLSIALPSLRFIGYSSLCFIFVLMRTTCYILSEITDADSSGSTKRTRTHTNATERPSRVLSTFQMNRANRFTIKNTIAMIELVLLFTGHLFCHDLFETCVPLSLNVLSTPPLEVPTSYSSTPSGLVYVFYLVFSSALSVTDEDDVKNNVVAHPRIGSRSTSPRDSPSTSAAREQRKHDMQRRYDERKSAAAASCSPAGAVAHIPDTIIEHDEDADEKDATIIHQHHHVEKERISRTPSIADGDSEHDSKSFTITPSAASHHVHRSVSFAVPGDSPMHRPSVESIGENADLRTSQDSVLFEATLARAAQLSALEPVAAAARSRPPSPILHHSGSISAVLRINVPDRPSASVRRLTQEEAMGNDPDVPVLFGGV